MIISVILSVLLSVLMWVCPVILYTIISKKELKEKYNKLWLFINRFTLDRKLNVNKNLCFGFTLFCGRQGGGKTYTAVKYCVDIAKKYNSLFISNTPLNLDKSIDYVYIKDISEIKYIIQENRQNIILLDEIQTLFDSKDFDKEFYSIFCQLRKRNIKLVGTAQVFERCALKLREQVHNLYYCKTYFGCLTRYREYYPVLSSGGKLSQKNSFGLGDKFIVQNEYIRNTYNTYFKI